MGGRGCGYVINLFLVSEEGKTWRTVHHAARYRAVLGDVVPLDARLGVRLDPLALLYLAEGLYSHALPCPGSPVRLLELPAP